MTLRDLMLLGAVALLFIPLEHLRPIRPQRPDWPRLWVDTLHIFISGAIIRWGVILALLGLSYAGLSLLPASLHAAVRAQPDWLEFIEILLLSDLAFYGAHRMCHAVPLLWRFHEIHHSSQRLDWVATHRVHPVDQIINATIIALPALALGFSPEPLLVYAVVYRFHAVLLHSNVRVDFGPLRWLIASPRYHHWHHAAQPDAHHKNFGGQLVIFDRLFRTLHLPDHAYPARYGISAPVPADYPGQLVHPFRAQAPETSVLKEIA